MLQGRVERDTKSKQLGQVVGKAIPGAVQHQESFQCLLSGLLGVVERQTDNRRLNRESEFGQPQVARGNTQPLSRFLSLGLRRDTGAYLRGAQSPEGT